MDTLLSLLTAIAGKDGVGLTAVASLSAFAAAFVTTWHVGRLVRTREDIRRRALRSTHRDAGAASRGELASAAGARRMFTNVASHFVPVDRNAASVVRRDLMNAGFFQPSALAWYYFTRIVLALAVPVVALAVMQWLHYRPNVTGMLGPLSLAAIAGLLAPRFYIARRRKKLQQQCRNGFPDFMDLMVVCAEAGVSMGQAIDRVSRELQPTYPFFGTCLQLASLELRAGRQLAEAFENLSQRLGIEEAHNLGSLLKQSEELGTSLAEALRVYSDEMRDKRMARAEEKAHALPAKLSVPLMVFVFPMILVVILLPAFVRISAMM